jgi:non-specific serine/threonine protein kinase/serine/threonine-protein kinase
MSQSGAQPWGRVKDVLAGVLERAAADRAAFLDSACGEDTALRREVESLLEAHAAAEASAFIESPTGPLRALASLEGHIVGPYRVLGEIGRGGMGAVYRAVRADDQYEKQVALKIVGQHDPDLVRRFLAERQILANLDHPGIARLIDGGATEDGLPWLAMEFVEGRPITEYVRTRRLPLRERLALFREVCAAVHYAHQNLVVHRDLKPSNILVTPAGAPRLLDFGIAKLLSAEEGAARTTLTMARAMTPEYASPEQVRGQPITTASDVYSLGVLLCEVLTGRLPYELSGREPLEVAAAVTGSPPRAPSTLALGEAGGVAPRELQGDLDTIVLMALRKEPERRYRSADQLSEDLRRYLERRPVIARPDTLRYRTGKFVRRNRALVATALVLGLSLVGALAVAVGQARQARRERARAEQRFEDMRQLAHSFLYEVHDAIMELPGSTAARQLLVNRGLEYLDRLSRDGGTPALQRDIANAYIRVGDLQGRPNFASLGDTKGALASYGKAVAALRAIGADHSSDPAVRRDLASALHHTGVLLDDQVHDVTAAVAAEREAMALCEPMVAAAPDDTDTVRLMLNIDTKLGDLLLNTGKPAEALAAYEKLLPAYERVLQRTGTDGERFNLAVANSKVGNAQRQLGRPAEALAAFERSRDILRPLASGGRTTSARRALSVVLNYVGDMHADAGDFPGAVASFREALALREAMAPADPRNALARVDLLGSYLRIGDALAREKDDAGAMAEYSRAYAITVTMEERTKSEAGSPDRAAVEVRMAEVEARQGRLRAALDRYERAVPRLEAACAAAVHDLDNNYDLAVALSGRARLEAQLAASAGTREAWE